jgi:hypothetical protein
MDASWMPVEMAEARLSCSRRRDAISRWIREDAPPPPPSALPLPTMLPRGPPDSDAGPIALPAYTEVRVARGSPSTLPMPPPLLPTTEPRAGPRDGVKEASPPAPYLPHSRMCTPGCET